MTGVLRFILSLFIGCVVGLVLMLISESLLILLSCGVIAFFAAVFLYNLVPLKKELKGLLAAAGAIVAFFLYFTLLNALNENGGSMLIGAIFFFGPFVAFIYAYTALKNKTKDNESKGK